MSFSAHKARSRWAMDVKSSDLTTATQATNKINIFIRLDMVVLALNPGQSRTEVWQALLTFLDISKSSLTTWLRLLNLNGCFAAENELRNLCAQMNWRTWTKWPRLKFDAYVIGEAQPLRKCRLGYLEWSRKLSCFTAYCSSTSVVNGTFYYFSRGVGTFHFSRKRRFTCIAFVRIQFYFILSQ